MISRLQSMFISLLKPWIPFIGKINDTIKYYLITVCFFADLVLFCVVRYVLHKESYFYNTACGIVLMIVIAILSLDRSLIKVRWRRSMWIAWFGMCICFTISDLLVPKKACGLGIILALVFTAVFFVWQNHTRKDLLWKCFKDAVKTAFWVMSVISFLFRPLYSGGRYAGIFTNPNTFALYLYIIFAVYMSDMDWIVETGRNWKKNLFTYISLALVIFYLSMTQARTSMGSIAVILVMWLGFRVYFCVKNRSWKIFLKNVGFFAGFCVVLYPMFFLGISRLPNLINHPIIFEGETLYLANGSKVTDFGETVVAESVGVESASVPPKGEPDEERDPDNVVDRFIYVMEHTQGLNALTSGRIDIYKGYTRKLNYKGHKNVSLVINGKKKNHAHNNWLQFGYTYGMISMFFYAIITVLSVGFSIKFYLKNRRKNATYAFLIPAICVGFVVATLTECLFLPFEVFPAFMFWFVCGELFEKEAMLNRFKRSIV